MVNEDTRIRSLTQLLQKSYHGSQFIFRKNKDGEARVPEFTLVNEDTRIRSLTQLLQKSYYGSQFIFLEEQGRRWPSTGVYFGK